MEKIARVYPAKWINKQYRFDINCRLQCNLRERERRTSRDIHSISSRRVRESKASALIYFYRRGRERIFACILIDPGNSSRRDGTKVSARVGPARRGKGNARGRKVDFIKARVLDVGARHSTTTEVGSSFSHTKPSAAAAAARTCSVSL